jgi:multidrug efflux pump subunit AcrA (membrane-fusion protein)
MKEGLLSALVATTVLVAGCVREPPPPSVDEFLMNRILLDAAMVRCTRNRAELKYTAECVNARAASNAIAREEAEERRELLEAQSERKRAALRRAQEAAAQARRRADEARRQREEADYLAQFGTVEAVTTEDDAAVGAVAGSATNDGVPPGDGDTSVPAGEEPGPEDADSPQASDLQAIREELERRRQESGEQR